MSPFEALPDELLLRIFNDNGLQPFELHAIASQSRKLRRVALDDSLWRPICATIVSGCSLLEDDEDIELMKWGARNFYFLWLYLLHQWSPFIGFWVASHSSLSRNIIYIAPSKRRGTIVVAQVLLTSEHIIGLGVVLETPEDNGTVFVDRLTLGYTILNESFYGLPRDGNGYPMPYSPPITAALPPFQRSRESSSWMLNWRASWEIVRPGIIPSPLMTPVIHSFVRDEGGIEYPCLSRNHLSPDWLGYEKYISLQPPTITDSRVLPSSLNIRDYPSNLIDAGLFAGLYGPHGIELLYITVRTLTAQDFYRPPVTEDGNPYTVLDEAPPEYRREGSFAYGGLTSRLGPFAQGWSPNGHISISTIKPGQRIIEAVKIHGDNNVPRGQRTFVGFLGDCDSDSGGIPLASADVREATGRFDDLISRHAGGKVSTAGANDEMCLLMEKYGLPVTSPRNPSLPWPTSKQRTSLRNPPMALSDTEMMASGEGWTIEGVGRIADMNFENPRWTDCLIHLESRRELLVWWLGSVVTYKRLECLSI